MDDVGAVAAPKEKNKAKEEPEDIGTVADFIELINTTVGKHFKCCICFSFLEDPVMLPCNHPLCRGCASQSLRQNQRCPQCLTAIPNLRVLQGRNTWIAEMVCSLKNCLNEVGVSLTQHAPVPPKYRDKSPPKAGAAGVAMRQRARERARASSGDASQSVSCSSSDGRGRGGARRKGSGRSSNGAGRAPPASSTRAEATSPPSSDDEENAAVAPVPPPSSSPPAPTPPRRPFVVGDLVFVDHRTWPGMNKHGGVALVTAVLDPPGSRYDVKYSVSRKHDRGVEARYVHEHAFPDETVGSRSRRGGAARRAGIHSGAGSGNGSGRRSDSGSGRGRSSLPPRGRPPTPVSAPAVSASNADTAGSSAATAYPAAAASPAPSPSSPRRAVGNSGEPVGTAEEEEVPGRERSPSAAAADGAAAASPASAAAADAVAAAAASSPGAGADAGDAAYVSERVEGCRGDTEIVGHRDGGEERSCDDAAEDSHHSDAASTITIREEEDAERADGPGYSSDDGDGGDYGGGSYDDVGDGGDDLEAATPTPPGNRHEGRSAAGRDIDVAVPEMGEDKDKQEDEEEEATRIEEIEDLASDRGKSPSLSEAAAGGIAGGAADGSDAPLSPTSRSNLPWRPPPPQSGLGNEQPRAGRRRRHDCPSFPPPGDTRDDTSDPMLAGAAEGLMMMALAANNRAAPAAVAAAGVEETEGDPRRGDVEDNQDKAKALTPPPPQSPGVRSVLHHRSNPRGETARSGRASLPTGSPAAATAPSSSLSPPGHAVCPELREDDTPVATAPAPATTPAPAPPAAGNSRQDDDDGDGDGDGDGPHSPGGGPPRRTSSMKVVAGIDGGARADTPTSTPSTASPPPLPSARPSGLTPPAAPQTPRQAMPPPPPPNPSPTLTLTRPSNSSLPSSSTPLPPPPPPTPPPPKTHSFKVGDLVSVPSRSSPGINKEGGVAKVTLARPDGTFDVKYIVRQGREKGVAAAILSPYAVDGDDGSGGGSGSSSFRRDSGERGTPAAPGTSPSFPSPSVAAAARGGGGGTSAVRRTPRANKGWCSPDIAAGQANAACLNYMLGDTQHPELILDPDLGGLLDPDEGTSYGSGGVKSGTGTPAGKARRQRNTSSSTAASASAAAANTAEELEGGDSDDGIAISGWEIRDGSNGGRRKSKPCGNNKRKRAARGSGNESDEGDDGDRRNEKRASGGSQAGSSQGQGKGRRRNRRRSNSEGSGTGDGRKNDVFDITALSTDSDSEDNVATRLVAAAADYDGASSSHEVFDISALSPASDVANSSAAATKKRSRPPGGRETPRAPASASASASAAAAAAATDVAGQKRSSGAEKGKGKAIGGKVGGSRSSGGGGGGGSSGGDDNVGSGSGQRGRAVGATEAEKPVVLTLSGSTAEMLTLANALVKSLGWIVEPKYTEAVTHVVCGTVQKNAKAKVRSAKFLRAVASGKWVVTEAWLQECKRRGGRAKEEPFEVSGDRKSAVPSAPTRSRLAHADPNRPGLFQGISFHFRGQFGTTGSPPLSELEAMLLANGGRVVSTIGSLFTSPTPAAGGGGSDEGAGRRSEGSGGGSSGGGSGSGGWRPRRVMIFQPSSASPEEDARVLEEDLASVAEAELSKQSVALASEGPRARGGGAGAGGGGVPDNAAIEVVKPIWLVDSVGCFRVLRPSVHHRLPSFGGEA